MTDSLWRKRQEPEAIKVEGPIHVVCQCDRCKTKQEQGEPHSWYSAQEDEWMTEKTRKDHERLNSYTHKVGGFDLPLYTTPPQRTWVGLSDEECRLIYTSAMEAPVRDQVTVCKAIEAKLKEKNG